jgi:DNA-binding transcriptional LysR family regulator
VRSDRASRLHRLFAYCARLRVAPIVPKFLKSRPGVDLELLMTDSLVDLVEDRIDLAIRIGA